MARCCQRSRAHPQDGAWSWLVCVCSAIAAAIVVGFSTTFGVFLPHLINHFQTGRERTAWVASLALSLRPCLGLISGPLCDRFGCRTVTICGSVLCTASLIASSYVTCLELMYVTYGVVYGIGSSFIFTSCLLITAQYFTKWRPLAITIVSGGIGAGILALGPTIHVLVDFFGWQGALRFVAGAMAFVAVLSYSYDEIEKKNPKNYVVKATNNAGNELAFTNIAFSQQDVNKNDVNGLRDQRTDEDVQVTIEGDTATMRDNVIDNGIANGCGIDPKSNSCLNTLPQGCQANGTYAGSKLPTVASISTSVTKDGHGGNGRKGINWKKFIDWSVWRVALYRVTVISCMLGFFSTFIPAVHLTEYTQELSIPLDQAPRLYIYLGITSFLGRPLVGFLSSFKWMKAQWLYQVALFGNGIAIVILPHISQYTGLIGYVLIYGACYGAFIALVNVLILGALNEQQRPSGLGMQMCLRSIPTLIGPPLAGLVADKYGSYAPAFYAGGGISIVAGALMFLLHCCKDSNSSDEAKQEEIQIEKKTFDTKL